MKLLRFPQFLGVALFIVVRLFLFNPLAHGQNMQQRPCIQLIANSSQVELESIKTSLSSAVTLSGDFEFFPQRRFDRSCWSVHILSMWLTTVAGSQRGFVVSFVATDPDSKLVGHGIDVGPDNGIIDRSMRSVVAFAVEDIRLSERMKKAQASTP